MIEVKTKVFSVLMTEEELSSFEEKYKVKIASVTSLKLFNKPNEPNELRSSSYHDYKELSDALHELQFNYPETFELKSIGLSVEGREIWGVRITADVQKKETSLPGIIFMGGHHAREHLSVEVPLALIDYLVKAYDRGDPAVVSYLEKVEVYIVPMVNPDGAEFDISGSGFKYWRKNRRKNSDGTYGVDLNRNYSYQWGVSGSSKIPRKDTYQGPRPFSEPETQGIRDFILAHSNITTLLTFHSFSELILYPWGYENTAITNSLDRRVHIKLAKQMSKWNHYRPMRAADLYAASGDTADWAYGERGIISFTFELDPKSQWSGGGFYPLESTIDSVFKKNLRPCLYLIDYADDPSRVLLSN